MTYFSLKKRLTIGFIAFILTSALIYGTNWLTSKTTWGIYTPGPTINLSSREEGYTPVYLLSVNISAVNRLQILLSSPSTTFLKLTPTPDNNLQYLQSLYKASFESALYNAQSALHLPLTYTPNGILVINKKLDSTPLPLGARIVTQDRSPVFSVNKLLIPSPEHPLAIVYQYNGQTYHATFTSFSGLSFAPSFYQSAPLPHDIYEQTGIGGSSAGLSQAIADVQILSHTRHLLVGTIAATGTLDESGSISPIEGLNQKLIDASKEGVSNFFYPSQNNLLPTAISLNSKMRYYPVATFTQALNLICLLSQNTDQFCKLISSTP
jgi:hypothetical protein